MSSGSDLLAVLLGVVWVVAGVLAALVLLGRQGYRDWRWYAMGAVFGPFFIPIAAERADRSVTVVDPGPPPGESSPRTSVVVGVDGSAAADRAVRLVANTVDTAGTRVVLVGVIDPDAAGDPDDERRVRARTLLLDRAGWFGPEAPADRVVTEVVCGQPARALRTVAAAQDAAVLVLGRSAHVPGAHLLGDVATQLLRHASVPLLLADPPPTARRESPRAGMNDPATPRELGTAPTP